MKKEFDEWFDARFMDCQGEDSPYSYADIQAAFSAGWDSKGGL